MSAPKTHIRSNFSIANPEDGILAVRDNSNGEGDVTVTNDAESVVASLTETGNLKPGDHLIYSDTEGRWDELLHDGNGKFRGFKMLNGASLSEAIHLARAKELPPTG